MTAWGEYLENNLDIYHQYYADVRDKSIFIPSNEALERHYNSTSYSVQRRSDAIRDQNILIASTFNPSTYVPPRGFKRSDSETHLESKREYTGTGEPISLRTEALGNNMRNIIIGMTFGEYKPKDGSDQVVLKERSYKSLAPKPPGITVSTGLGRKSQVLFGSLQAKQGTLWVIDDMFEFPESASSSLEKTGLSKFSNAVEAAGFQEKYDSADQVTIFAPIDESFNSSCSCSSLSTEAVEDHVVYGAALYNSVLKDGTQFKTCQGKKLKVTVQDGETYVNGIKLVEKDIITLNGVIHKLERPLVDSDYDHEEWPETAPATPVATEYKTYYEASTTVVEVKVTSTPLPTSTSVTVHGYASVTPRSPAETTSAGVAVTSNSTNTTTTTPTPLEFTGSASTLEMVDMRITLGTLVVALAAFMF